MRRIVLMTSLLLLASCATAAPTTSIAVPSTSTSTVPLSTTSSSLVTETSATTSTTARVETVPADAEASVDQEILEEPLVVFEANWLCDVQRFAFATPQAMDQALQDALVASGITTDEYAAFRTTLEQDEQRRVAVLHLFEQGCPLGS